jgi:stress-induced-phosphoprotein 1
LTGNTAVRDGDGVCTSPQAKKETLSGGSDTHVDKEREKERQLCAVLLSNRSAASMSMGQSGSGAAGAAFREAQSDAKWCVKLAPKWAKGYSRLGTALAGDPEGRWEEAVAVFEEGLEIDPESKALKEGLTAAVPKCELEMPGMWP